MDIVDKKMEEKFAGSGNFSYFCITKQTGTAPDDKWRVYSNLAAYPCCRNNRGNH